MTDTSKRWWVSWYWCHDDGSFEIYSPWWFTGSDMYGRDTVCAALLAPNEDAAREQIFAAYDERPDDLEFRFVDVRPDDWSPFCDRFQRGPWMRWPDV